LMFYERQHPMKERWRAAEEEAGTLFL
jgi:hypothetical protein